MKADIHSLTITHALVKEWEDQAITLEKDLAKRQGELQSLRARIQAALVLLEPIAIRDNHKLEPFESRPTAEAEGSNMIEAMATIANSSDKPLTKAAMKARLQVLGFPEERMGNYFYTCVARLKG
ncbi:MAG: hypothetical protein WBQ84_03105, partial [Methylocella sp.]